MTSKETVNFQVEPRSLGKHMSRKLRREKRVPAVVYGPKIDNLMFSLEEKELAKYLGSKHENTIFRTILINRIASRFQS